MLVDCYFLRRQLVFCRRHLSDLAASMCSCLWLHFYCCQVSPIWPQKGPPFNIHWTSWINFITFWNTARISFWSYVVSIWVTIPCSVQSHPGTRNSFNKKLVFLHNLMHLQVIFSMWIFDSSMDVRVEVLMAVNMIMVSLDVTIFSVLH
jgi:hypothetical protein